MTSIESVESQGFQQFRSKEGAVKALSLLLNDPVMKEALRLVQMLSEPAELPIPQAGVNHDVTIAHHYHFLHGIKHAVKKLHKLATILAPNEPSGSEREEFEDHAEAIQPFDLKTKKAQ